MPLNYDDVSESLSTDRLTRAIRSLESLARENGDGKVVEWCRRELGGYEAHTIHDMEELAPYRVREVIWLTDKGEKVILPTQFDRLNKTPINLSVADLEEFQDDGGVCEAQEWMKHNFGKFFGSEVGSCFLSATDAIEILRAIRQQGMRHLMMCGFRASDALLIGRRNVIYSLREIMEQIDAVDWKLSDCLQTLNAYAKQVNAEDLADFCSKELIGYQGTGSVPAYRNVPGDWYLTNGAKLNFEVQQRHLNKIPIAASVRELEKAVSDGIDVTAPQFTEHPSYDILKKHIPMHSHAHVSGDRIQEMLRDIRHEARALLFEIPTKQTEEDELPSTTRLIFISHKETDAKIAESLVNLVLAAIEVDDKEVLCTSVAGHQLPFGSSISEQLRNNLDTSTAIVALLTEESIKATWVLFELGAAWATGKIIVPILGPGLHYNHLPGPLTSYPGVRIDDTQASQRLMDALEQIAAKLSVPQKSGGKLQARLDDFITAFRGWRAIVP